MESQILAAISHIKNISKKRPTNECILSCLNQKWATNWDKKTVKEVLCSLRAKNLFNSNDKAESEENGIPNLPTADVVHIKPVELDKDVQLVTWIISNPLTPARVEATPPFSVYTPTKARIVNTEEKTLFVLPYQLI